MLNWIERTVLKRIHKKQGITLTKNNLVHAFDDLDGNGYYKFPKGIEIPINRLAKMQEYLMWLSKGVDKNEYKKAIAFAKAGLEGGIKDGKGLAKIGFILEELETRCDMVIHDELFYNIIAVQLIRHDEAPTDFNNEIQMQKVEAFKKMDTESDVFFLNIQEYLQALGLSNITKIVLEKLLKESQAVRGAMEKMLSTR